MAALDFIRSQFPVNRVVAFFSPVLVGLGATVSTWLVDHLPFIADQVDQGELTTIFVASAAAGVAAVYKWLDGWQQHEALVAVSAPPLGDGAPEAEASQPNTDGVNVSGNTFANTPPDAAPPAGL